MPSENECEIDQTLMFYFDSHCFSGTSTTQIEADTDVEIESVGPSASTSKQQAGLELFDESSMSSRAMEGSDSEEDDNDVMIVSHSSGK